MWPIIPSSFPPTPRVKTRGFNVSKTLYDSSTHFAYFNSWQKVDGETSIVRFGHHSRAYLEGLTKFWSFWGSSAPPYSPFCTLKMHTFDPIPLENPSHNGVRKQWVYFCMAPFEGFWQLSSFDPFVTPPMRAVVSLSTSLQIHMFSLSIQMLLPISDHFGQPFWDGLQLHVCDALASPCLPRSFQNLKYATILASGQIVPSKWECGIAVICSLNRTSFICCIHVLNACESPCVCK